MQLVIETDRGVSIRSISPAMPLRLRGEQGKEAEVATHDAAALWGLADFVFEPALRKRASGVRELGDGIVVLGDLGVVLQVKSREALTADPGREKRWVEKVCRKGLAQGAGTIRELEREPAEMTNLRGRTIQLDGRGMSWVIVVVIDHDDPPRDVSLEPPGNAVFVLRRDWDFLFEQLKSTHGVVRYLRRVAGEAIELGDEPIRYYELASLDAETKPAQLNPMLTIPGSRQVSEPLLPMAPAGIENETEHRLFRGILEDIASIRLTQMPEHLRLWCLAELDRLSTRQRALVGQFLLEGFEAAWAQGRDGITWRHRRLAGDEKIQLGFAVCSHAGSEMEMVFGSWIELRHHEFMERVGSSDLTTIGVLVTPRTDGKRPWDTSMTVAKGRLELSSDQLEAYVEVWKREEEVAA